MRSSNPVFARSEGFNGRASGMTYPSYDAPPAPQYTSGGGYDAPPPYTQAPVDTGRMTIDSVVQKTGLTLGTTIVVAAATWFLTGPIDEAALPGLYTLSMLGALTGFVLAMVNSFKKIVSPGLVLAYAVAEGVFVGAFSKALEAIFGDGLVFGAVLGTFAAVAGTLAAYKFFNIQVSA